MNVLMYPLGPDDDFPEMFCAIRQGSGEHWFYVPEGESASWMLFRAESENAKLRELAEDMWHLMDGSGVTTGAWGRCVQILDRMRGLGMEVS